MFNSSNRLLIVTTLVGLFAIAIAITITTTSSQPNLAFLLKRTTATAAKAIQPFTRLFGNTSSPAAVKMLSRTPVYFVSHGGPDTMYDTEHPVFPKLQAMGREITQKVKPKAILVFSAHWQSDVPDKIQINTSESEPLLYDFYGFPRHYYMEKFPNKGSPEIAKRVTEVLGEAGIKAEGTDRGLDHGVFVPFKIMFDPKENPVNVPIVQVSLWDDDTDAMAHIKLGRAVEKLREEGICIVVSGMAVHNLRHLMMMGGRERDMTMPYSISFDGALKNAVETAPGPGRDRAMEGLLERQDARLAHPTFEHLIPIHVGVGAAGSDVGKQLWTLPEGSMSWAQYKFGEVEA